MSYTFVVLKSYDAAYVVFMSYNMIPLIINAYQNHFIRPALSFYEFISISGATEESAKEDEKMVEKSIKRYQIISDYYIILHHYIILHYYIITLSNYITISI